MTGWEAFLLGAVAGLNLIIYHLRLLVAALETRLKEAQKQVDKRLKILEQPAVTITQAASRDNNLCWQCLPFSQEQ